MTVVLKPSDRLRVWRTGMAPGANMILTRPTVDLLIAEIDGLRRGQVVPAELRAEVTKAALDEAVRQFEARAGEMAEACARRIVAAEIRADYAEWIVTRYHWWMVGIAAAAGVIGVVLS